MLNKIILKKISVDDVRLPKVIKFSIGDANADKIKVVIKSYGEAKDELIGAYLKHKLVGLIGYRQDTSQITIRHISILPKLQKQGIGTLLIDNIKQQYDKYKIIAETDEESVAFYRKCGFTCNPFRGKYNNLRYGCGYHNLYKQDNINCKNSN